MTKINKNNPFKVPEGYFDGIENRLATRLSQEESILPQNEGFQVPEGYFDGLHERILRKLEADETKVIPIRSYKTYWYVAASVAAMLLLFLGLNLNGSEEITFESLASSEIERYFEDNESDFSTYEIAEMFPVDELEMGDVTSDDIDDEDVLEYLDNNTDSAEELNFDYDE
ncbi:MAG: hypothetical protein WA913_14670 [Pricia sp.]